MVNGPEATHSKLNRVEKKQEEFPLAGGETAASALLSCSLTFQTRWPNSANSFPYMAKIRHSYFKGLSLSRLFLINILYAADKIENQMVLSRESNITRLKHELCKVDKVCRGLCEVVRATDGRLRTNLIGWGSAPLNVPHALLLCIRRALLNNYMPNLPNPRALRPSRRTESTPKPRGPHALMVNRCGASVIDLTSSEIHCARNYAKRGMIGTLLTRHSPFCDF